MIGLLSFHESTSYGAILQCYALQVSIERRGNTCEFIDYRRKTAVAAPFGGTWKTRMKRVAIKTVSTVRNVVLRPERKRKASSFDRFRSLYLNISEKTFWSYEELADASLPYDTVIVGSDQVWNPVTTGENLKVYGLGFVSEEKKKIAYAASIGLGVLNEAQKDWMRECLSDLDFYSCREYVGAQLLEEVIGKKVEYVMDPTFLLDYNEWRQIEKTVKTPKKYVLAYLLGSMSYERSLAKKAAKELGARLLIVKESPKDMFSVNGIGGIGPDEMLYLIDHAEFVVTDSFHGTALSINYRKNFLCCNRRGYEKETSYSSRLTNLLHTLNLEARQVTAENWKEQSFDPVDYGASENNINNMISISNRYLDLSLSE